MTGINLDYSTMMAAQNAQYLRQNAPATATYNVPSASNLNFGSGTDILTLSTKQEKTNDTAKTVGIIAGIALAAGTIWAASRGKKINAANKVDSNFFKNIGTGLKSLFTKAGRAEYTKVINASQKHVPVKITQESLDTLTKAKTSAQDKVDDLTRELSKHKKDSAKYKTISEELAAAKKELDSATGKLLDGTKKGLLQADGKYTQMTRVRDANVETLATLKKESTSLQETIQQLTKKQNALAKGETLDADDLKKLQEAKDKLAQIGHTAVKGKNGTASQAATGQIKQLQEAIQKQSQEISSYSRNFADVAKARAQAATDAQALANFRATLNGGTAQQSWQVTKLNKLEQAAKASETAQKTAETAWAATVEGYAIPDFIKKALNFGK